MGRTKPLSTAVRERLALWYLTKGKNSVTLEQLIDMAEALEKPCCISNAIHKDHASLQTFIHQALYKRNHPEKFNGNVPG